MDADSDCDEELPGMVEDSSDDDDVYEELPDLMEDSSDDDDVYVELTIMTQTEPEVETALDSEPLAAGACYALRAEGPGAGNLQEQDCPSDDEELEDGTAMPLKEHEDEIPDWRELRRQRQAAGQLHLSGHTLERLALVRAVPHSTTELTYIIDLDRTGGKEGRAKQGLFLFAGMLSVLFTSLVDGLEVQEFIDFMARVFGEPNAHHAHKCGDASLRSALWWTNTFTQHCYQAVQHEFERPPRETYAQIVERCSAVMREACLLDRDHAGFYTRQELGFTEEEMVTSKLINPKDSKQPYHWAISEGWKDKEGFAALMDSDPE
eukprot:jgi/Tetstr1/440956/TSEL_029224.t1